MWGPREGRRGKKASVKLRLVHVSSYRAVRQGASSKNTQRIEWDGGRIKYEVFEQMDSVLKINFKPSPREADSLSAGLITSLNYKFIVQQIVNEAVQPVVRKLYGEQQSVLIKSEGLRLSAVEDGQVRGGGAAQRQAGISYLVIRTYLTGVQRNESASESCKVWKRTKAIQRRAGSGHGDGEAEVTRRAFSSPSLAPAAHSPAPSRASPGAASTSTDPRQSARSPRPCAVITPSLCSNFESESVPVELSEGARVLVFSCVLNYMKSERQFARGDRRAQACYFEFAVGFFV
ncbi:hypothetical protein EVAR_86180_1 [Eumeta japonica]|uniref:Uncharacterized protein n=1 Tax=Eumeta variegata TaxID=151549 RepID=A0A4C1UBI5_EUMVA|nr:hypothetical protein EVAR_86180_1 [Eumeta japonica]